MCRQKAVIDDLLKGYTKQDPPQLGQLLLLLLLLLLLTNKFNVAFSPEELQGHGTHIKRRSVQYSTVLVVRPRLIVGKT